MNRFKLKDHLQGDWHIWLLTIFLSLVGILVVYSSISALVYRSSGSPLTIILKHSFFVFLGLFITYLVSRQNFLNLVPIAKILLWLAPILLIYTLLRGTEVGGAKRWISIMGLSFQTSDLIRLVLITNLAAMLAKKQNQMHNIKSLLGITIWTGLLVGLLAMSSFSTSVILGGTCLMLMIIGGVPFKHISRMLLTITIGLSLALGGSLVYNRVTGQQIGRVQTVIDRIESFVKKDLDGNKLIGGEVGSVSMQQDEAIAAVARGGIFGVGAGKSAIKHRMAESYSDFIYAILVEEWGLFGGLVIMAAYLYLLIRGLINIQDTKQAFGGLLSIGLTLSIVFQAFAHMIINVGLGPVTGQTLPLISKGGSSILFTSIALGIVLSVSRSQELAESSIKPK